MDRGYLKLWRKSLESEVFACPHLWRLWSWCLMKTTYKPRSVAVKTGKGVVTAKLNPGQFIFGRHKAAEALQVKASTVWDRMNKLDALEMISIQSNSQYSIVSICNWNEYQGEESEIRQPTDRQPTTNRQPTDTNKKGKKDKKDKKKDNNNGEPPSEVFDPVTLREDWIPEKDWLDLIFHRKNHKKKPPQTERAYKAIIKELSKASENGFAVTECVDALSQSTWQTFKACYMDNRQPNKKSSHSPEDKHNGFDSRDYSKDATSSEDLPEFLR